LPPAAHGIRSGVGGRPRSSAGTVGRLASGPVVHARATGQGLLPWLVLGPLFAGAGAGVGLLLAGGEAVRSERTAAPGAPSFAPLVAAVQDAVVGVRTVHRLPSEALLGDSADGPAAQPGSTSGTGFLIHEDGLVLTARHVVANPSLIAVQLPGLGTREAELIGEDPATDIAVLRLVDAPEVLPHLELGASERVRQGDWVVTIGNPLALRQTVTAGVVGFVGRHIGETSGGVTNEHLQFGAPAYPGSSGSPVFDLDGAVVGMTTRAAAEGEGFAFAVTARVIRRVLASMERHGGRVRRAHLGASVDLAAGAGRLGEHPRAGGLAVQLRSVARGYAAHRAGLEAGDLVTALGGRPIASIEDFYDRLTWAEPGTEVVFDVIRDGLPLGPVRVELGELGDPPREPAQ
jgi:S1-C subfamily serine protease